MKFKIIILLLFLAMLGTSMSSCVVRRGESQRNNGNHYGWYKTKKQHKHKVYVIKKAKHNEPKYKKAPKAKQQSAKKQNKNHWNAKK